MTESISQLFPPPSSLPTILAFGHHLDAIIRRGNRPLALMTRQANEQSIGMFLRDDAWSAAALTTFARAQVGAASALDQLYDVWIDKVCERLAVGETLLALLVAPMAGGTKVEWLQHAPASEATRMTVEAAVVDVLESLPLMRQEQGSSRIH